MFIIIYRTWKNITIDFWANECRDICLLSAEKETIFLFQLNVDIFQVREVVKLGKLYFKIECQSQITLAFEKLLQHFFFISICEYFFTIDYDMMENDQIVIKI